MFFICSAHPPSFLRNPSSRRSSGSLSNPDSVTTSNVPLAVFSNRNSTSVLGSFVKSAEISPLSSDFGMWPGKRKQPLRLHLLDHRFPFHMLVPGIGNRSARDLSRRKWPIQFHAETIRQILGSPSTPSIPAKLAPSTQCVSQSDRSYQATSRLHITANQ